MHEKMQTFHLSESTEISKDASWPQCLDSLRKEFFLGTVSKHVKDKKATGNTQHRFAKA